MERIRRERIRDRIYRTNRAGLSRNEILELLDYIDELERRLEQ